MRIWLPQQKTQPLYIRISESWMCAQKTLQPNYLLSLWYTLRWHPDPETTECFINHCFSIIPNQPYTLNSFVAYLDTDLSDDDVSVNFSNYSYTLFLIVSAKKLTLNSTGELKFHSGEPLKTIVALSCEFNSSELYSSA